MKIAIVHDDLVQWGGAERVLSALAEIFPQAPIYTSVYDSKNKLLQQYFASRRVVTSFIQKIPGWRSLYKTLLPLYPIAFEQFDFSGFDVVISHTTRFAKSIITRPETFHICYCHTPPRFLWNFSGQSLPGIIQPYLNLLRKYDQISAKRVDQWIAGSINAQNRIRKIYQAESKIIYPFVDIERFSKTETFDGGYLLAVSRLNSYKRVDLVIRAANQLKIPLRIVGSGPAEGDLKKLAGSTIEFLGTISEDLLSQVLAGCKALVVGAEEDFGLCALEAQALGKPVVAYKNGGSAETVVNGQTGYLFEAQTKESLINALSQLDKRSYNEKKCKLQAEKFSKKNFMTNFGNLVRQV